MDLATLYYVCFRLIIIFDCFYIGHGLSSTGYNLYFTEARLNNLDRDCLYYTVPEKGLNQQLIPYCIRFHLEDPSMNITNLSHDWFTFSELRHRNITSYQLFKWSAPIDVVERYQMFLENISFIGTAFFYNCTFPWFGGLCEYHFENAKSSFADQAVMNFNKTMAPSEFLEHFPCYTHLKCDFIGDHARTPGVCLDWREVCDGKVHCSDGGLDEEHCWELEMNECDWETEFRCHNGLCIPIAFLNDDLYNPDCLDRTDEAYITNIPEQVFTNWETSFCFEDHSIRCEDHQCRTAPKSTKKHSCGDGVCADPFSIACTNGRSSMLLNSIFLNLNVSSDCLVAFRCFSLLLFSLNIINGSCDYGRRDENAKAMKQHCPPFMKIQSIQFEHLSFVYTNDQVEKTNRFLYQPAIPPDYVCYDSRLCHHPMFPFVVHPPVDLFQDNTMCQRFLEFEESEFWAGRWDEAMDIISRIFRTCSTYYKTVSAVNHSNLYACQNSSKVISKHRLRDGVKDCFHGDDESYSFSCSLNATKHRFKCQIRNETICLAHVQLRDGYEDCTDESDELIFEKEEHKTRVSFCTMCDGFTELTPVLIDDRNETDETECEHFECNNIYTRCDGYWNCLDGADEMNCEWPPLCQPRHHLCLSPVTDNVTCLPIERVNDGKHDCFGHADEREYCRLSSPSDHYQCWKRNRCSGPRWVCPPHLWGCGENDISLSICSQMVYNKRIPCWENKKPNYAMQALCSFDAINKRKKSYFTLIGNESYAWTQNPRKHATTSMSSRIGIEKSDTSITNTQRMGWHCNRGIQVHRFFFTRNQSLLLCLCPPPYFGEFCHLQNQRVTFTLQMKVSFDWRTTLIVLISLHDDRQHLLESYDQIQYLAARDCNKKFNVYLLYKSRPKTSPTNHSIRFDVYSQHSLEHRASWSYPIRFPFLPVHRLAYQLAIPSTKSLPQQCDDRQCGVHGYCSRYVNTNNSFCVCDKGWSGSRCELQDQCGCSWDSLCLHSQVCLCALNKFGPRCYAKHEKCPCNNGGTCAYNDERLDKRQDYFCICADGFSGSSCEIENMRIEISFGREFSIPLFIFTHFIQTFAPAIPPARQTVFSKLRLDEDYAVVRMQNPFHLAFVELEGKAYYLTYLRSNYTHVSTLSWKISPSNRCLSISEVFNDSFAAKPLLHRMKKYYLPCKTHMDLPCFYDDTHICVCDRERRQSNCLEFNHNATYNCEQRAICENNGQCFTDDLKCPTTFHCACSHCSYGSRCQFVRSKFDLSLDSILGYQIQRHKSFTQQRVSIKFTVGVVSVLLICGIVSNALSILTFRTKKSKEVGSGYYMLTSSCVSLCLIILFSVKAAVTIMTHMGVATNRDFLSLNCRVGEFVVKVLLNYVDWLNAVVAVERAVTVIQETSFNRRKVIMVAKRVIIFVLVLVIVSNLQDPIRRRLIDDNDESRTWCITEYNQALRTFNLVILISHFIGPFSLNTISIVVIIYKVSRRKADLAKKNTYVHHLMQQVKQFKHQLIIPVILVLLGLPRVVISFSSDCMETPRGPWLVLIGLFVSFLPPVVIGIVNILLSDAFRKQLFNELISIRLNTFRC